MPDTFASFLEDTPPGGNVEIALEFDDRSSISLQFPEISLYCADEKCNRQQMFKTGELTHSLGPFKVHAPVVVYECRNCGGSTKRFALLITVNRQDRFLDIVKIGEYPPFGPFTPAKLIALLGPDREVFLKGRRCESQGLGIGAFAYYRRIVETQKSRIFDQMIKVANAGGASELAAELEQAKGEQQFSKAIGKIKAALPDSLLIRGHNPLNALHNALSEGLHVQDDDVCLQLAHDVRLVLTELAERMAQILKDDRALGESLARLAQRKSN